MSSFSGVFFPTQAASIQCSLGKPLRVRLNFVNPPEPVSIGSPILLSRLNNSHLVVLTAAASFSGAFACAFTWLKSLPRKRPYSSSDKLFFSSLCLRQAQTRLLTRFDPPRDQGRYDRCSAPDRKDCRRQHRRIYG